MAKYDYGGGCPCGLYSECEPNCIHDPAKREAELISAASRLENARRNSKIKKLFKKYTEKQLDKELKMSLRDKLIKNSTLEHTSMLSESKIYSKKDMIPTPIPMINVALSGSLDGGITPGVTMLAGPSKHFKTGFALLLASAFLRKYKDGLILFYDSEFGTPQGYFDTFNIPHDSVIHSPVTDVEELKHDLSVQLKELGREDKIFIVIDSIGNLASKKETEDAIEGKTVADMTRAKALKSFFRIVTAKLTLKDIPMVVINHTYKEIGLYPKDIVGGGTGSYYGADNIWILGRQQDKDDKEIKGYHFIINVEKSRYVKEKSKIPITVSYDGGINKWSGLLDLAVEAGYIVKPKNGWYAKVDKETGELSKNYRASEIDNNSDFWKDVLKTTDFASWIKNKYTMATGEMMENESTES
jgi:RecA/RadA recombinase